MKLDENILEEIKKAKIEAKQKTEELIDSRSGYSNTITAVEVRNLRIDILHRFQDIKTSIPNMIYHDIVIDMDDNMNGVKEKLNKIQDKLTQAKKVQGQIHEDYEKIKEQLENIEKRNREQPNGVIG